jgi:hypothetical protein
MPLSAATGLSEAALAAEATTRDQRQAASRQAPVSVPETTSNRPDLSFNSALETSKAMKIFSSFGVAGGLETLPKSTMDIAPAAGRKLDSVPLTCPF